MRTRLRTALISALTLGLLAFFFRNAQLGEVWREMRAARLELVAAGLLCTSVVYLVRAIRWQYLLRPVGPTRFRTAFRTTVIGFAATFLLPARAGEFLRPYLLARQEGLSATATFATVVFERLLDLLTVLALLGVFVAFFDPGMARVDPAMFRALTAGGMVAAAAAAAGLAAVFLLSGHPERLERWTLKLERIVPGRLAGLVSRAVARFAGGLGIMRRPGALASAAAWSFPLWLLIGGGIWLVTRGFHIAMPFPGSILVMALLVVGVAVPTPGAIGGFHAAYQVGVTRFYGADADAAVGAALVLHAVSFVPVTLLGILFMAQDGLGLAGVRRLAQREAALAEEPAGERGRLQGAPDGPPALGGVAGQEGRLG